MDMFSWEEDVLQEERKTAAIEYEKNGFDLLRYAAALSVMLLHYSGYAMIFSAELPSAASAFMDRLRKMTLLFPGVVILFTMSGFLVSASFERVKTKKEFFHRRILRMYPELWLCTIINLAVLCIVVPELLDGSIVLWLGTQFFGIANTPECLKSFATGSVNGALWTVFTEVQLYLVLGILYPFLKKMKNKYWAGMFVLLAVVNLICAEVSQEAGGVVAKLIERTCIPYALWFFAGVFCFQKRHSILKVLQISFVPLLFVYLVIESAISEIPGYYADIATSLLLPLLTIGCGYCLPAIRLRIDLSYEMFLYHWIVLNVIIHYNLMNRLPWYVCLLLFLCGTMIIAAISRKIYRWILNKFFIEC